VALLTQPDVVNWRLSDCRHKPDVTAGCFPIRTRFNDSIDEARLSPRLENLCSTSKIPNMSKRKPAKPVPRRGDCYESSYKNASDFAQIKAVVEGGADDPETKRFYDRLGLKNEVAIVHGWITSPKGPNAGKRVHHAWIEIGDCVIETQGGMSECCPDRQYYKIFEAYPNQRYSVAEADTLVRETGWAKAWRGTGEDRPPENRPGPLSKYFDQDLAWLGTRSRRKRAENTTAPTLEQITTAIRSWAPRYANEIESVWIYGSRARQEPARPDSDWDVAVRPKGATADDKERIGFDWLDFWANELGILCPWRIDVQMENPPRTPRVSGGVREHGILVFESLPVQTPSA
jgi:predicted nucleotidyltransferase